MRYFEDIVLHQIRCSRALTLSQQESIAFAKEWDPQPFHIDEEAAKDWPLGLTASGLHTISISVKLANEISKKVEPSAVVAGLGWDTIRFHASVKPDDQLTCQIEAIDKRLSKSKPDMGIVQSKISLFNQDMVLVLSYTTSTMLMRKPEA